MADESELRGSTGLPDEYVKLIGEIIVHAADLERIIAWCIWKFMGSMNDAVVHPPMIVTHGLNVSSKLRLLRSLIQIQLKSPDREEFVSFIGEARTLFKIRNKLAHGPLALRFTGGDLADGLNQLSTKVETNIKTELWEIDVDTLRETPIKMMKLASALSKFMKRIDNRRAT